MATRAGWTTSVLRNYRWYRFAGKNTATIGSEQQILDVQTMPDAHEFNQSKDCKKRVHPRYSFPLPPSKVLSVVIVNTLLTSVMGKLAKFERHVSLSDYTSTVTAKLAIAQFLNTALVVIIVNAGYTGGGLGLLQVRGVTTDVVRVCARSWMGR